MCVIWFVWDLCVFVCVSIFLWSFSVCLCAPRCCPSYVDASMYAFTLCMRVCYVYWWEHIKWKVAFISMYASEDGIHQPCLTCSSRVCDPTLCVYIHDLVPRSLIPNECRNARIYVCALRWKVDQSILGTFALIACECECGHMCVCMHASVCVGTHVCAHCACCMCVGGEGE